MAVMDIRVIEQGCVLYIDDDDDDDGDIGGDNGCDGLE